jgi:superfamily II DNA helicase RecQ
MEDKISIAREKLEITFPLKEQQLGTLQQVYEGKDCISVLPTGYGKSIIYQMIPWF